MKNILLYTSIPAILMALGGIQAFIRQPSEKFSSLVQHFAAGVVFSAVAVEIIPKIVAHEIRWLIIVGFLLGLGLMFVVDAIGHKFTEAETRASTLPLGMIVAVGVDVFIDGLLIGVSFLVSTKSGIMISLALALEVLFLGLSTSASMAKNQVPKVTGILLIIVLAVLIPAGAWAGFAIVSHLSQAVQLAILSFGVAALLYLVTEELLTEAHEVPETRLATSAFFIGFLLILLFA